MGLRRAPMGMPLPSPWVSSLDPHGHGRMGSGGCRPLPPSPLQAPVLRQWASGANDGQTWGSRAYTRPCLHMIHRPAAGRL